MVTASSTEPGAGAQSRRSWVASSWVGRSGGPPGARSGDGAAWGEGSAGSPSRSEQAVAASSSAAATARLRRTGSDPDVVLVVRQGGPEGPVGLPPLDARDERL